MAHSERKTCGSTALLYNAILSSDRGCLGKVALSVLRFGIQLDNVCPWLIARSSYRRLCQLDMFLLVACDRNTSVLRLQIMQTCL